MNPNDPIDRIIEKTNQSRSGEALQKPNLDRGLNKLTGIFAILLGIYLTTTDLLFGGYAGPIYFFALLLMGPLCISLGIHLLKKKDSSSGKTRINLPRAIFIALGITILAFYLLFTNARF